MNYRFPLSGKTLLQFALQAKTWNIVDSLLQQNADVGITDEVKKLHFESIPSKQWLNFSSLLGTFRYKLY